MHPFPTQISISRQVWVCDTCGCQDNKSCSCESSAHAEELAAKREANRQANRRLREKTQQNQRSRDNHAPIDNIREFPKSASSTTQEKEIRAAEAKLSTARMQNLMFDSVCRLLAEMSPHTRLRVKHHMEECYGNDK